MAHDLLRPRAIRRFEVGALLALGALVPTATAGVSGPATGARSQDFTELFAPPKPTELDSVRLDWASRQPELGGFRLEATGADGQGALYDVVSHISGGQRHYGAVRFPRNYVPGQPYGTLVVCHGGLNGVSIDEASNFLTALPGQCIDDEYFLIIPSYRGEALSTPFAGTFQSGGTPSYADRDVDDVQSLLAVVLANYPDIDHARIGGWGISRGGAVALLLSVRDERIRRLIDMFGFTDLSLPSVQAEVELIVNQGAPATGMGRVAYESCVLPWLSGALTIEEARLAWIRRSPCYFAVSLAPIQAHHGLQDTQVDPSHTIALLDAMAAAGIPPNAAEGYFYPNGAHGLNSLPGHGTRVEPFICELQLGPRGYCGPMAPHATGMFAAADYRGSASISRNDLVFRANNCPPSGIGLAFIAPQAAYLPSGAGFLCVGLGAKRIGLAPIDAGGTFELPINMATSNPSLSQFFNVGSSAYFQLVFRDLGNPAGMWNFSNGLELVLTP